MNTEPALLSHPVDSFVHLAGFIEEARIGLFTTTKADGTLHSRPLVTREVDPAGHALWFFAASHFLKAEMILNDKEVAITYVAPNRKGFVTISGRTHVVHDLAKVVDLWTPMTETRFPRGVDDPGLVLLRVDVGAANYWDSP